MYKVKSFDKPTDIYIIGMSFKDIDIPNTFSITDDETSFQVKLLGSEKNLGVMSDGFVYIFTLDEFIANMNNTWDEYPQEHYAECVFVPQFIGDINLTAIDSDGVDRLDGYEYDPEEYVKYQPCLRDFGRVDVVLEVPADEARLMTMEELYNEAIPSKRDITITDILK